MGLPFFHLRLFLLNLSFELCGARCLAKTCSTPVKRENVKLQNTTDVEGEVERAYLPEKTLCLLYLLFFEVPQVVSNVCFVLSIDKIHLCKGLLGPLK